jgi:hypothetical protein
MRGKRRLLDLKVIVHAADLTKCFFPATKD